MTTIIEGYDCDRCRDRPGKKQDDSADPLYLCVDCLADLAPEHDGIGPSGHDTHDEARGER